MTKITKNIYNDLGEWVGIETTEILTVVEAKLKYTFYHFPVRIDTPWKEC